MMLYGIMPRYTAPNVSLYLRNVPDSARGDELRGIFSKYGQIRDIYIPSDHFTGRMRGFAYVEFEDIRDAEDAVYHLGRGIRLHGRDIEVEFAVGDRKTPHDMRKKYGGPYRSHRRSPSPRGRRRSRSRSRSRSRRRYSRSRSRSRRRSGSRHRSGGGHRRRRHSHSRRSRSRNRSGSRSRGDKRRRTESATRSKSRTRSRSVNGRDQVASPVNDVNLDYEEHGNGSPAASD